MTEKIRPTLQDEKAQIICNTNVGGNWYRAKLCAPAIAKTCKPGQFVHMQIPGMADHMLRRPLTIFDVDRDAHTFDVLYATRGFGSSKLSTCTSHDVIDCIGPVGNGWDIPENVHSVLLVGHGTGIASLYMLAKHLMKRKIHIHVVLSAPHRDVIEQTAHAFNDILNKPAEIATPNGSLGFTGTCADCARDQVAHTSYDFIACSAPKPISASVARLAKDYKIPCQVWLGSHMGCGVGACLGCVVDTTKGRLRVCVDGPMFDAKDVIW